MEMEINVHEMYAFKCKILVEIIFCEKKKCRVIQDMKLAWNQIKLYSLASLYKNVWS